MLVNHCLKLKLWVMNAWISLHLLFYLLHIHSNLDSRQSVWRRLLSLIILVQHKIYSNHAIGLQVKCNEYRVEIWLVDSHHRRIFVTSYFLHTCNLITLGHTFTCLWLKWEMLQLMMTQMRKCKNTDNLNYTVHCVVFLS